MTIEILNRRRTCGTRSGFWGWLGLDPRKELSLVLKQQALDAQYRESYRVQQLEGLPEWMRSKCYRGQVPVSCLLGLQACGDARICLMQRLMEYQHREVVAIA